MRQLCGNYALDMRQLSGNYPSLRRYLSDIYPAFYVGSGNYASLVRRINSVECQMSNVEG